MNVKLIDQNRRGLGLDRMTVEGYVYREVRATTPVIEALRAAGAAIATGRSPDGGYQIAVGSKMPHGIVAVHLNSPPHAGLRMENEPEYPGESEDFWLQVEWTPCPVCGAPVVWNEGGHVPGYRICIGDGQHHSLARRRS